MLHSQESMGNIDFKIVFNLEIGKLNNLLFVQRMHEVEEMQERQFMQGLQIFASMKLK